MIQVIQKLSLLGLFFLMASCAHKVKILDVAAVSNKVYSLKKGQKLVEIGDVSGEFCTSNDDEGQVGLMDMAINDISKKSKVHVLKNVSFFRKGSCMIVEGTGARIKKK